MIVQYSLTSDLVRRRPLTDAEIKAIEARAPKDEDIVFDEECPPSTSEQLKKFRRVHISGDDMDASNK